MASTFEEQAAVFTTVDQLRPDTKGHNLVLKVSVVHCIVSAALRVLFGAVFFDSCVYT